MRPLSLIVMILCLVPVGASASRTKLLPFTIRTVVIPRSIPLAGEATLSFELTNRSSSALTICTMTGFQASVGCKNADGWSTGWTSGASLGSDGVASTIDPATGKITCVQVRYLREDFLSLAPGESHRFDVDVYVPDDCSARVADVTVSFTSRFDGSDLGLKGWTGTVRVGSYSIPVASK